MKCKSIFNYVATHPELQTTAHPMPPLFVLRGAARTGSTFFYNLLACDLASRTPLLLDMMHLIPPLVRYDTVAQVRRNVIAHTFTEKLEGFGLPDYEREWNASHPLHAYEEDVFILNQGGLLIKGVSTGTQHPKIAFCADRYW